MIAILGAVAILAAFLGCLALAFRGLISLVRPQRATPSRLQVPVLVVLMGAVASMGALQLALLTDDFSVAYVADHSASTTPFVFKIASAWAALEGSIVLWGLILALCIWTVWRRIAARSKNDQLWAAALGIMGIVGLFFFGLMLTVSNPFQVCLTPATVGCLEATWAVWTPAQAAMEGLGPNPLLQNHFLMALHPPLLYAGYVGLTVPFAFAMSALLIGRGGAAWLEASRSWTLVAWGFLTLGIVLGGLWSYEVLGWGGYWAWDPVENASFIPWLIATAFIHSSIVQRRRGMLQAWNFVLVILAFASTILGTFLTRSGIISSVHSFSQSPIGPILLWFLAFILVVSFGIFAARLNDVASSSRLDSMVSREGFFLVNNLVLSVFAFVVMLGTLYPLFLEAITGDTAGVGPPFFNRFAIPISLVLLVAMAIGSIAPWRSASPTLLWERIRLPFVISLAAGALAVMMDYRDGYLLLGVIAGTLVIATAIHRLFASAHRRTVKTDESMVAAIGKTLRGDRQYWSGQLSHIGVAILAIGIALSSNLAVTGTYSVKQFDTVSFAGMELMYLETVIRREPNREVIGARIVITRDGRQVGVLEPGINSYFMQGQSIGTPSVATSVGGDLYLTLVRIDDSGVSFKALWFPYVWLVWAGGLLIAMAPLWGWLGRRRSRIPDQVEESTRQ
ncbi:MAG: heme lyase CcmF/NrfE family subunit [Actinobacteria bacterium]|nr:MAG: heme lyase CcmF/NrfE family subunit [Actinomycetota bacterium]